MPTTTSFSELMTARQIAQRASVPFHRVDYAIQRLGITETARVGIVRLYDGEKTALIQQVLSQIAAATGGSVTSSPTGGGE